MTTRIRNVSVFSGVQERYQEHFPENVTVVQTAKAHVLKEFTNSRRNKIKYLEVVIGLGLSDLSKVRGRSYRLYLDPTGAGKHRLYGYRGNTILTIHFIDKSKLEALEEYRRGMEDNRREREFD